MTDYELYVGQILKLPTFAGEDIIGENEYVVQKGDSLYSIATKYGTTVDELKRLNNLSSNALDVGQVLRISGSSNSGTSNTTYTVQRGDTLYSIARNLGTTVEEIKRLNNLSSNTLSIGQVLKISGSSNSGTSNTTYTVQKGDSLYSIAREYNTTVEEIKRLNNLSSNLLSIGQILKIPS